MLTTKRCPRRVRRARRVHLRLEGLETRCLLSGPGTLSPDALFHETLDAALDLNTLGVGARVTASGTIGAGPEGAADVNWYKFVVSDTAEVRLSILPGATGSPLDATLSLYNDAPLTLDPFTFTPTDPYTPNGHRLLAQDDGGVITGPGRPVTIDRLLGPGTYWVAVSGSGNDLFDPFLAGSGLNGRTGSYRLSVTASDPGPNYDNPPSPVVLASDPAPGAVLGQSPFVLRFDLNAPIDDNTLAGYFNDPTTLAQLLFNTSNDFSPGGSATDVTGQYLAFGTVAQEPNANELQIAPAAPLASGFYEVILPGYGPGGSDYVAEFQVAGPAGNADPTQQPGTWTGTAYDIPGAADGRLHQVGGAVGVDPTDPSGFFQAGVELYHFSIDHPGAYALDAEVFASRIGSPLDAALSLFKVENGAPVFVASNGNTDDAVPGTNGLTDLFADPALFATLGPGDYYLAVSATVNFPDPNDPGNTTFFDPSIPQSGSVGSTSNTTGPYVLNLLVQPEAPVAPHVVSVRPDTGPNGNGPLTDIQVRFDRPVNLLQLAFERYLQTGLNGTPSGVLSSATLTNGQQSFDLRLGSYDSATNTATFILLGAVPAGRYTLTLSGAGAEGIVGLSGLPLAGNAPGSTTFTATFSVAGSASDQSSFTTGAGFDTPQHAQPIGALFPDQLGGAGVTIGRDSSSAGGDTQADYSINLLQSRAYTLTVDPLGAAGLPPGLTVNVIGANGVVEATYVYDPNNTSTQIFLNAGTYVLQVTWSGQVASYDIVLGFFSSPESPTPLVVGAGPALRVRLLTGQAGDGAPSVVATTASPPPVVPVASGSGFLAGFFALPSSALLAQGFSPLEGVFAAGGADFAGGDRLLVSASGDSGAANSLLNLVIVTQVPLTFDPAADAAPVAPPTPNGQGRLTGPETVTRLLDLMFEFWSWLGAPLPPPASPAPANPAAPDAGTLEDGDPDPAVIVPEPNLPAAQDEAWAEPSWGWAWACAVVAGVMAMPPSPRPSSERPGRVPPPIPRT